MIRRAIVTLFLASLALPATAGAAEPRTLARLDGTLTGATAGAPEDVALRYVIAHRSALGLDASDLDTLGRPRVTSAGEITQVRWRQAVDGIPAVDSELRVNLAADGRILNVLGDPAHDLSADTTPRLDAGQAVRAVQDSLGEHRAVPRDRGPSGATRAMTYADGTTAELALDDGRLMWRVTYRASSTAVYDAFVDARSGNVRRRVNLVKSDTPASVWEHYPGATDGGAVVTRNLEQNDWLAAGATRLSGPNVHAFSDVNDDDLPEEIGGSFNIARAAFSPSGGGCVPTKPCTWNHNSAGSWETNRRQNAVQAFYFANRFHDHLAAAPISFDAASGSFDGGSDPVQLQTDDGAASGPDGRHVNNANMFTPPDGTSPVMQMYLWRPSSFRTMNGGDDASILYHEYTHGLSSRLVTDASGRGALNSPEAGAMGEGWSDWYAKDFLVSQFPALDGATVGDVDMGIYTDATTHSIRSQGLDCPVFASAALCPGAGSAGSGGYTYGDFSKVGGEAEVHADGEIWAETLWDLRRRLITDLGTTPGVQASERLITQGMRLSPPEPSFLDMRNAILLADQAAGGANRTRIWSVFATRGMGYFATTNNTTTPPLEDYSLPPAPGDPRGRIAGTLRDSRSGAPVRGATAAIGGLALGPDALAATSGGDGSFAIEGVPARTYPNLVVAAPGYDTIVAPVTVSAGATTNVNSLMERNWAATIAGATVTPGPGSDEYANQGCGPDAAADQSQGTGWSTDANVAGKSMVLTLPQAVDVSDFAVDPGEACGDDSRSATRDIRIEASTGLAAGPWVEVASTAFADDDRHKLKSVPPVRGAAGVRHVRVTLLSAQGGGDFFDLSEFAVHGKPSEPVSTQTQQQVQTPTPTPTPVAPAAPTFSLPASGKTTVKFSVTCALACAVTAELTVDRPTAKRLGLGKSLTAGSLKASVKAGKTTLTLKLKSKAKKALLKGPKKRTYRARLKATAAYPATTPTARSRQLTLKR